MPRLQDTVTRAIEQNMNGIDNLMYMSRRPAILSGSVTITLTFQSGTDPDIARAGSEQTATGDAAAAQEVQQQGISESRKRSMLVAGFISDNLSTTQMIFLTTLPPTSKTY